MMVLNRFTRVRICLYVKREVLKGFSGADLAKIVKKSKKRKKKAQKAGKISQKGCNIVLAKFKSIDSMKKCSNFANRRTEDRMKV